MSPFLVHFTSIYWTVYIGMLGPLSASIHQFDIRIIVPFSTYLMTDGNTNTCVSVENSFIHMRYSILQSEIPMGLIMHACMDERLIDVVITNGRFRDHMELIEKSECRLLFVRRKIGIFSSRDNDTFVTIYGNIFNTTICELSLYGCSAGTYGVHCNETCNCDRCNPLLGCENQTCDIGWTGPKCNKECSDGWHGSNCSEQCGHCKQGGTSCNPIDGFCLFGCVDGWRGLRCKEECASGLYGDGCNSKCGSCHGNAPCNRVTGECSDNCTGGWKTPLCQECQAGKYGDNCTQPCGHCVNRSCDFRSGHCIEGCTPGYKPPTCVEECRFGRFGMNCSNICGNCYSHACDMRNGTCLQGCVKGWTGISCQRYEPLQSDNRSYVVGLIVACTVIIILVVLRTIVCCRRQTCSKSSVRMNVQGNAVLPNGDTVRDNDNNVSIEERRMSPLVSANSRPIVEIPHYDALAVDPPAMDQPPIYYNGATNWPYEELSVFVSTNEHPYEASTLKQHRQHKTAGNTYDDLKAPTNEQSYDQLINNNKGVDGGTEGVYDYAETSFKR